MIAQADVERAARKLTSACLLLPRYEWYAEARDALLAVLDGCAPPLDAVTGARTLPRVPQARAP